MKQYFLLLFPLLSVALSGCKMAEDTKSGWYTVHLKDTSGEFSGKTILQVTGESMSRGLHQAVLQYHSIYKTNSQDRQQDLFVIITNRRKSEDYIIVTTPEDDSFRFPVYSGGLIFDKQDFSEENNSIDNEYSSIAKLVALMNQYDELKISQGSYYFTIKTNGFDHK